VTKAVVAVITTLALFHAPAQQRPADDFPVASLQYKDGNRLVHLHSRYGFVAKWEADGKSRFYLYDKLRANISVTTNFQVFLNGLSHFPDRSEVAWVNTCSAPLHYGMPPHMLSQLEDTLKTKKFVMAGIDENNFPLCTCEATNLSFFTRTSR
jgi:hypothetical protein